jgi:hypothetical protein
VRAERLPIVAATLVVLLSSRRRWLDWKNENGGLAALVSWKILLWSP